MGQTSAWVNIHASNNATLQDAFQFGTTGDTSWSFTGQHFIMEIKASRDDVTPLLTLDDAAGEIVVDDAVQRVLHLNVSMTALQAALPVNDYVYDLIMFDGSVPPVRVQLMQGHFYLKQGVTEN
jgi:hypothetical protein